MTTAIPAVVTSAAASTTTDEGSEVRGEGQMRRLSASLTSGL
jgi:hypothetical protein